jgi:signal transduction histidine kinase
MTNLTIQAASHRVRRDSPPTLWFVLPLLALTGIGLFGIWREQSAAAAELQRRLAWQAENAATTAEPILKKEIAAWAWAETWIAGDGRPHGGAWFSHAPLPHAESDATRAFAAGLFDEVVDSHPGALSQSGLPLGPMAAFRRLLLAPDDGVALVAARQVRDLAFAYPSVISPDLLEGAEKELTKRGLIDPHQMPWRDRWEKLERVATAFQHLLESPTPPGLNVRDLGGELWRVEVKPDRGGHLVRLVPLAGAVHSIGRQWQEIPLGNGTFLSLVSPSGHELLSGPAETDGWPRATATLDGGSLLAMALGDPQLAAKNTHLRVALLGGVSLAAAGLLGFAWRRQQVAIRMQRELARQKDDFLATVSHELRTPVASIQLLAGNLAAGITSEPEAAAAYHRRLLQEASGLAATTEHLLDFSLMERGQKTWRFEPLDTTRLSEEIQAVLEPLATGRQIALRVDSSPIHPPPVADVEGIRRIILNLADNAIKYSMPESRVKIHIGPAQAGHWSIRVSDDGPGIPPHEQSRIFDRFFRGGEVLSRINRGTGIGLSVARHIAEGHGGILELSASSTAGSIFTCTLPLHPESLIS